MKAIIVSIDHDLQLVEAQADPEAKRAQKHALRQLLAGIMQRNIICMVFEEAAHGKRTIAMEIADSSNPQIPWRNIVMTPDERRRAGIFEALQLRPSSPDMDDMTQAIELRIPEDDVREDFFADEINQARGMLGEVLVLLGDMHVEAVSTRLKRLGFNVELHTQMITKRRWISV